MPDPYRGFRYPSDIINEAVWLYYCFSLSLREVELILAQRGVEVSYETIRQWSYRFGQDFANKLRRRRPRPGDKWHMDEVFVRIQGRQHYLWRAVDQDGAILDILVQSRRNAKAAKRFFRKLLKGLRYVPRVIVTDQLKSYGAAKKEILPGVEHRQSRYPQQPRRELAPAHTEAGAPHATLQVGAAGPAFSLRPWPHLPALPAEPPPNVGRRVSGGTHPGLCGLAEGDVRPEGSLRANPQSLTRE